MKCPFKFNAKTLDGDGDLPGNEAGCQCEESKCEFWIAVMYTTELVIVSGCAIRLNAMKDSKGMIVV